MVRAFVDLGEFPREWDTTGRYAQNPITRVPTDDEVRVILEPWRSERWRQVALKIWIERDDEAVTLRTHYDEQSDARFAAWRAHNDDMDPNYDESADQWWILNDPDLFNFGDEWWRVFDVLPELVRGRRTGGPPFECEYINELRGKLQEDIERRLESSYGGDASRRDYVAMLEAEYGEHGQELQDKAVSSYLFIADASAFETDYLRLVFLDRKGNVVRHSASEAEYLWDFPIRWWKFCLYELNEWVFHHNPLTGEHQDDGAELGDDYRASGKMGRLLYGLGL